MKIKNRNHQQKRVISPMKFSRIFANNLANAGVATIYRDHNEGFKHSLMAVEVDGIVYCRFERKTNGDRLDTYTIRYSLENPLDFISFKKYDVPVFAAVEF